MILSFGDKETEKIWNGFASMKNDYDIESEFREKSNDVKRISRIRPEKNVV